MAYEITLGYRSAASLTYGVYAPNGSVRTAAGTTVSEVGSTGYYVASNSAILPLDFVIVKEGTTVVMQGQYQPQTTSSSSIIQQVYWNGIEVTYNGDPVYYDTSGSAVVSDISIILAAIAAMESDIAGMVTGQNTKTDVINTSSGTSSASGGGITNRYIDGRNIRSLIPAGIWPLR